MQILRTNVHPECHAGNVKTVTGHSAEKLQNIKDKSYNLQERKAQNLQWKAI